MLLPEEFINTTRKLMGEALSDRLFAGLGQEPPVTIRINPLKCYNMPLNIDYRVPWCNTGYYLTTRPAFTFDPLLHAGLYYVQEASSMFIHHVLRQLITQPVVMLDLCAAPGGKSTAARTILPKGSLLMANDPIGKRAQVLAENLQKFGHRDVMVSNNYPRDFQKSGLGFDVVLADVPCSGEGMFRRDADAIGEWSAQNVARCWQLQREIVSDIWPALRPGGLFIYSTCTFNAFENEENVRWICESLGALPITVSTQPEWNITGSLVPGFQQPVYRFLPGISRGEGLFMAVLQKHGSSAPTNGSSVYTAANRHLRILHDGMAMAASLPEKGTAPHPAMALSAAFDRNAYPLVPLSYPEAISYLRGEALRLSPDVPRGYVAVTYLGIPLGFAKNIGSRANNLHPQPWRIKSTHVPDTPPEVLNYKA